MRMQVDGDAAVTIIDGAIWRQTGFEWDVAIHPEFCRNGPANTRSTPSELLFISVRPSSKGDRRILEFLAVEPNAKDSYLLYHCLKGYVVGALPGVSLGLVRVFICNPLETERSSHSPTTPPPPNLLSTRRWKLVDHCDSAWL